MKTNIFTTFGTSGIFFIIGIFCLFGITFAEKQPREEGENCLREEDTLDHFDYLAKAVDKLPESTNWDNVNEIIAEDGSVWSRATISRPTDTLEVIANHSSEIIGLGTPGTAMAVFTATAEKENGSLKKPNGTSCFVLTPLLKEENFSFSLHAQVLWESIGQEMIIDFFYRSGNKNPSNTEAYNQNFHIGTHVPATVLMIDSPPPSDLGEDGTLNSCRDIRQECTGGASGGEYVIEEMLILDPNSFDEQYKGNIFDPVGNDSVHLMRASGQHTIFAGVPTGNTATENDLREISLRAYIIETIKRFLLAQENGDGQNWEAAGVSPLGMNIGSPGIERISPNTLKDVVDPDFTGSTHPDIIEFIEKIKNIFIGESRQQNAQDVARIINDEIEDLINNWNTANSDIPIEKITPEQILTLFPESQDEEDWARDFQNIVSFWTGGMGENHCLMRNDKGEDWHFVGIGINGFFIDPYVCGDITYIHTHGNTPSLLLHSTKNISLVPEFPYFLQLVYADKEFTKDSSWYFSADEEKEIYYEYDVNKKLNISNIGKTCLNRETIADFSEEIGKEFSLRENEKQLITKELQRQIHSSEKFEYSIADPKEISQYFTWKIQEDADEQKIADIFQIFLKPSSKKCNEFFVKIDKNIPLSFEQRDGFEVGFLE